MATRGRAGRSDQRRAEIGGDRRALVAGCVGNLIEWYDFGLYGAFAGIIATEFFPTSDEFGALVATFGVFGIAFLARPAGALAYGHYGDRIGRRRALTASILLMAVSTAGIGVLPGYAAIGWLAPILLTVLRLLQGVSVGGEYGGSAAFVVEYARHGHRGWFGAWQWATIAMGLAVALGTAAVLNALLPAASLRAWGWRVPFLVALPLGITGLYIRTRLDETPAFRTAQQTGTISRTPLRDAVRSARPQVIIGFWIVAAVTVTFNVFYVFLPSALAAQRGVPLSRALGTAGVCLALGSLLAPTFGRWSDRMGRRPLVVGGVGVLTLAIVPAAALVGRGDTPDMVLGYALIGVPLGALALSAFLTELFPTRVRYSGLSLSYGIASAVFGGSAPVVAAALTRGGHPQWVLWYVTTLCAVAVACALAAPETAHRPLDDA